MAPKQAVRLALIVLTVVGGFLLAHGLYRTTMRPPGPTQVPYLDLGGPRAGRLTLDQSVRIVQGARGVSGFGQYQAFPPEFQRVPSITVLLALLLLLATEAIYLLQAFFSPERQKGKLLARMRHDAKYGLWRKVVESWTTLEARLSKVLFPEEVSEARLLVAQALEELDRPAKALEEYRGVIESGLGLAEARSGAVRTLRKMGKDVPAEWVQVVVSYLRQLSQVDVEAVRLLVNDQVTKVRPERKHLDTLDMLLSQLLERPDLTGAIQSALEGRIDSGVDEQKARLVLARNLMTRRDMPGASAQLARALALDAKVEVVHELLWVIHQEGGDLQGLHQIYSMNMSKLPDCPALSGALDRLRRAMGKEWTDVRGQKASPGIDGGGAKDAAMSSMRKMVIGGPKPGAVSPVVIPAPAVSPGAVGPGPTPAPQLAVAAPPVQKITIPAPAPPPVAPPPPSRLAQPSNGSTAGPPQVVALRDKLAARAPSNPPEVELLEPPEFPSALDNLQLPSPQPSGDVTISSLKRIVKQVAASDREAGGEPQPSAAPVQPSTGAIAPPPAKDNKRATRPIVRGLGLSAQPPPIAPESPSPTGPPAPSSQEGAGQPPDPLRPAENESLKGLLEEWVLERVPEGADGSGLAAAATITPAGGPGSGDGPSVDDLLSSGQADRSGPGGGNLDDLLGSQKARSGPAAGVDELLGGQACAAPPPPAGVKPGQVCPTDSRSPIVTSARPTAPTAVGPAVGPAPAAPRPQPGPSSPPAGPRPDQSKKLDEAIALWRSGSAERALGLLQSLSREGYPDHAKLGAYLALCFLDLAQPDLARTEIAALMASTLGDEELYVLGVRCQSKGLGAQARDLLRKLYAQNLEYEDVKERLKALTEPAVEQELDQQLLGYIPSRYQECSPLGRGGMGVVFRAKDTDLERTVAIKLLCPFFKGNAEIEKRFLIEARTLAKLKHPGILEIYDINKVGIPFIAMEFLEGFNLADQLRSKKRMTLGQVLKVMKVVAETLAYCHSHGVVHRDVKLENIFITARGETKLLDFGLARSGGQTSLTRPGMVMGSPPYMSPEQLKGEEVDFRTDVYSVGVCLYYLCTGRLPFKDAMEHFVAQVKPPRQFNANLPPAVEAIILRCLAKSPADRYQDCQQIAKDLAPFVR